MSNLSRKTVAGLERRAKRQKEARQEIERLAAERREKAGLPKLPTPQPRPKLQRTGNRQEGYKWFRISDQGQRIPL